MSSVDLVILGLLMERPKSAYEIQKDVEYRHISYWVKVSTPSIYKKVLGLCAQGYLSSEPIKEGNMPEKSVYTLTKAGRDRFNHLMEQTAQGTVSILFEFNALVANLNKVEPDRAMDLIVDLKKEITTSRDFIANMLPQREDIALVGRTILSQQVKVANALLEWIEEFESEFLRELEAKNRR